MNHLYAFVLLAGCITCLPSAAQTVYRCGEGKGKVTYSDAPCGTKGNPTTGKQVELPPNQGPVPGTTIKPAVPAAAKASETAAKPPEAAAKPPEAELQPDAQKSEAGKTADKDAQDKSKSR